MYLVKTIYHLNEVCNSAMFEKLKIKILRNQFVRI